MTYSFTHFAFAILLVLLFRNFSKDKKNFPKHYLLIALAGALLPDLDIIIYFIFSKFGYGFYDIHRTFSHSILIPVIFLLIGIFSIKKNKILSNIFLIISIGVFSHLVLDFIVAGKIELFYPFSSIKVGLNLIALLPAYLYDFVLPIIDTIVLVLVIFWIDRKKLLSFD
jgi:membrane-bound metal-dependent hydrolase YbcI (DUF457 family)